jgi:hypothetical protein
MERPPFSVARHLRIIYEPFTPCLFVPSYDLAVENLIAEVARRDEGKIQPATRGNQHLVF